MSTATLWAKKGLINQRKVHLFAGQQPRLGQLIEAIEDVFCTLNIKLGTGQPEAVAAIADFHPQPQLDLAQVRVERAAEVGQPPVVVGLQDQVNALLGLDAS